MNKKKSLVLVLLMVAVLTLTTCMLVACNSATTDTEEEQTETVEREATEGLIINNSDFYVVNSLTTYPTTATDWTGAKSYSSGSYADDVISGIISLDKTSYDANKATWKDDNDTLYNALIAGNRYGDSDTIKNALLIYMPEEVADAKDTDPDYGPTAYGYTSASFALTKSKYYKLSVDVLTKDIKGELNSDGTQKDMSEPGARIYISSNTYVEFKQINTNGEWKTYSTFIEVGPSDTSLTLNLSLGHYSSSYTKGLTTGYAVFDNIVLEALEDDTAKTTYDEAVEAEKIDNTYTQTTTLTISNGRFDFGTTTLGTSSSPSNWTVVTGNSSEDDAAPTSKGYNAIIDASKFSTNYDDYSSTFYFKTDSSTSSEGVVFANLLENITTEKLSDKSVSNLLPGTIGSNIYMLSQQVMTAQGLKSSKAITIEKNKIYDISINLYTYSIHGAGVSLILSGSNTKDIVISGISKKASSQVLIGNIAIDKANSSTSYIEERNVEGNSTKEWQTYHFYIQGNQFYDYTYNLTVWLGTEGTSSNNKVTYTKYSSSSSSEDTTYDANGTFANGWVFMDDAKLTTIDSLPNGIAVQEIKNDDSTKIDVFGTSTKAIAVSLITDNELSGSNVLGSSFSSALINGSPALTTHGFPEEWSSALEETASTPVVEGLITVGLVDLTSEATFSSSFVDGTLYSYPGTPYENISNNFAFLINAKEDSYYEMETEPINIKANNTYRLSFWVKTLDVKSTSGIYAYLMKENDAGEDPSELSSITCVNTKVDDDTNDWIEFTFYICGANDKNTNVFLKFTLGTGTRWSYDTITSGSAYVTNMNLVSINYEAFGDATTGTYAKSVDLSSSYTYSFTNGSFDTYDKEAEDIDASKALHENTIIGDPSNWTISDIVYDDTTTKTDDEKKEQLRKGVIQLKTDEVDGYSNLYFSYSNQTDALFGDTQEIRDYFNNMYGSKADSNKANYLKSSNLETIAGPYMLTIGSKDSSLSYAVGYTSSSFSMSANTSYKLSVYVKTMGATTASVFLTGETSGSTLDNYFTITTTGDTNWTQYTYYITVGQSSVSAKLNLWLGTNKEYVTETLSNGTVFFDNVTLSTIDEKKIPTDIDSACQKKLSFVVDGFDSLSSSIESRKSLSTPSNWSGAVDTNQTSSNTKSGVIYVDSAYLTEDTDGYITILGKEYTKSSYEISDEELTAAKADSKYESIKNDNDKLIETLQQEKYDADRKANLLKIEDLKYGRDEMTMGKQMLVVNNIEESAYIYSGSSISLDANSYYKVSVSVRTLRLNEDETAGAYIQLYLGDAEESDNPMIYKAIKTDDWQEYEFYVATLDDSISSVAVKLALGKYYEQENDDDDVPSLTSGYAFFDNVQIVKVDQATFDDAKKEVEKEQNEFIQVRTVELVEEGTAEDDDDEGETSTPSFNLEYLWWMIPTIILGLLTIIVVIVWIVKKAKAKQPKKETYNNEAPVSTETIDEIRSKYDKNKE